MALASACIEPSADVLVFQGRERSKSGYAADLLKLHNVLVVGTGADRTAYGNRYIPVAGRRKDYCKVSRLSRTARARG